MSSAPAPTKSIPRRPLKAFVRFDRMGRIIPGSLVMRLRMPKIGKWIEINPYQCCVTTTTVAIR